VSYTEIKVLIRPSNNIPFIPLREAPPHLAAIQTAALSSNELVRKERSITDDALTRTDTKTWRDIEAYTKYRSEMYAGGSQRDAKTAHNKKYNITETRTFLES
jgi:hypothetical protein